MKKNLFLFLFTLLTLSCSFACLNGTRKTLKDGTLLYFDKDGFIPYGHTFAKNDKLERALIELDGGYIQTKNIDYLSDKGLVLILLGRYEEAINLYKEIETTNPNLYATASNIGTAYELMGDNQNALYWIKKSIRIEPLSHDSSEWLHIKILEAKLSPTKPISSQSLLLTDFGKDSMPVSRLSKKELSNLMNVLYFQLNERTSFVKPNDKIVALLMADIGNTAFLQGFYREALEDYHLAEKYGFSEPHLKQRIEQCKLRLDPPYKPATLVKTSATKTVANSRNDTSFSEEINFKKEHNEHVATIKKTTMKLYATVALLSIGILSVMAFSLYRRKMKNGNK